MSDIEINFEWIPSHCGVRGNKIADTLAKKGAQKENIELEMFIHIKEELTNHMSSVYKEIWQFQWESSLNGRHLWRIQPNVTKTENIQGFN